MPPPSSPSGAQQERLDRFEAGYAGPLPRLRPDLLLTEQQIAGRTNYIIKDPISLRYFRVERQELALAGLLDGKRNARLIREELAKQFPDFDLDDEKIVRFVNTMAAYGFLLLAGERSLFYIESARAAKRKQRLSRITSSFLYFRFSLYDPDKLFGRMARKLRFIWTKPFGWCSVAFILVGVTVVLLNWQRFIQPQVNFFTIHNLFLAWLLYIFTKVVHEFGHGLTCKNYGAEVHEIGLLLIVLTPCFYVDVSDAWMVRNKWHRVLITAAGIYVEVMMAAAAALVWLYTEPGLANQVAFNLMILCSISTFLFNANPLLRFDGYYIVSDWMEVPNLRTRSNQYVNALLSKLLFGRTIDVAALTGTNRHLFAIYAIASYIYGIFILLVISFFFEQLLEPVGLSAIGTGIGVLSITLFFVMPFIQLARAVQRTAASRQMTVYGLITEGGRARRPIVTLTALGLVLAGLAFVPSRFSVEHNCVIQAIDQEVVHAIQPGFVREVRKKEGDAVEIGTPVAILENRELQAQLDDTRDQVALLEVAITHYLTRNDLGSWRQTVLQRDQLKTRCAKLEQQVNDLTLRAPISGVVTTPRLQLMLHRYLRPGEAFCAIAPLDRVRAVVPLNEQEANHVRPDADVRLKVYAHPGRNFTGRVSNEPLALIRRDLDPALSSRFGGDVPTEPDLQAQGREKPSVNTYLAELDIVNSDRWLRPGMTGRAEIFGARTTWGGRAMRAFWDSFSLDFRL
jgi:putative peptide zinc metalloprotease protein